MALVKNPLMSVEARGTVAGVTFSVGAAGPVAKKQPIPTAGIQGNRPNWRSILGYLSKMWGKLENAERQAWRDWAQDHPGTNKFGDPFIMSGSNAYTSLNHTAIRVFGVGSENALPPENPPAGEIISLVAASGAVDPGDIDLTWSDLGAGIAADKFEIWQAGPFQSQGRVEVISRFKFVASVAGNVLLKTISDLNEGFWYWFRVRYTALDGQITAWAYAQATPKVTV